MIITHIKKTYVIFICLKDVFGKNLPIYTFNNICEQDHSLTLGDEATKVIVNAEGSRDDLSENMRSFLDSLIEKKATKEQTGKEDYEHTRKSNEGTDRGNNTDRRQHKGCVSSRFGKNICTYI